MKYSSFYFVFNFFHTMYFNHVFSTPHSSQFFPTSLTTQLVFFLKKKCSKNNKKKKTNKTQMMKQKATKKPLSFLCIGQLLWALGLCCSIVDIPSKTPLEKVDTPFVSGYNCNYLLGLCLLSCVLAFCLI